MVKAIKCVGNCGKEEEVHNFVKKYMCEDCYQNQNFSQERFKSVLDLAQHRGLRK